ncbi:MAG: hypothetical protein ACK41C_08045 [Phenylobacterium sp.]|jgi:hypothetical protein|uniref:hypothetical protein n=1 Tax=Phenylobacterium sp. TaxID=1871053 RepID=UPI0039194D08
MPTPPGLPDFDLPMIFGDKVAGLGFQSGVMRLVFAADIANDAGEVEATRSGYLILTPDCMLQLRSTVDQMLGELERRGLISITPDKLHG